MACSSQSASDYVRQARVHLIRELKNLSAIVENLYLHKILNDGEVSELQAETDEDKTRKILDSVLRKGEAACYEFLRIIYMTRRRTSGRPSPLPEKKSEASAETTGFDLQFWISCFPFEEDTCGDMNYLQGLRPCHRYQAKLKSKAIKMSEEFWMANKCLFDKSYKPDLSYMPLVLDAEGNISPSKIKKSEIKKSMMSRAKMLKTYIPEYKPEISPSDLLKIDKNIVLVGPAGIGKTALSLEMLKLWAESDSEDLDYMFYFDMRDTSEVMKSMSLEDLLFSVFSEPDEGKEEVLDDIKKNSDNVTIIFDGITDLCSSVAWRLATKDLLPDAKIIITCRPDDEEDFFPWDFLRVEVKGFSEQSIKTYLSAALGSKQSMVLSNLELLTLCHVPMYALMVAACISSGDSPQPCTITEVYICVVRLCLQTTGSKTETRHLNSYITSKRSEILSLAEVAFYATEGKSVNLTELPIKDNTVLSFLKPLVLNISSTTYAFHHYTMQEFFAALWLLKNPDKVKAVLQQCLTEEMKHMRHLIPFMCRLLHEKNPSLMKYLIPPEELKNTSSWFLKEMISTFCDCQDEADTEGSGSSVDILFLCQCLYESQCPEACIYLLDKLDYCLDLTGECLDPYSCCAVAYVVTQSQDKKIRLDLEDVTASEQGMRCLFGCLKNVQWCDPLPRQVWEIFLLSEGQMDYISLLDLDGNWMHLPVEGKRCLYERAVHVMKMSTPKVNVCLYWDWPTPVCPSLCACLLEALPYISSLSFRMTFRGPGSQERDQDQLHGVPDVKLGPSRADTKPGVSEDDTKPMQPPLRFKPPLKTKCSSWMTFRGPGSQDRDQDQLHAGFPDVKLGPSRADTKPGVSEDDTKPMQPPLRFTPQLKTDSTSVSYSFKCPGPGQFQCALTGLVFVMTQKAELFYKTVQWDEGLLQSASKIAAGPLFNIKCPEDAVCQLHLPHCVSNDDLHYKRLLSVIHITDDGMSILKPLEITETHVIVKVPHLSCYGLAWPFESIWKFWRDRKVISSQVLLFLRPPNPKTQRKNLNVFLLPRNVPLEEVIAKHRNSEYIEAPSKCKLIKNQNYTVHCPNAYKIQPEEEEFDLDYGPNYHPTFEIRLPIHTEEATITVRDQANANVWEREVDLTGPGRETARSASAEDSLAAEDNLPPEDRLLLVRRRFITGVSDAVLDQLLDRLLERGVVTDDEMQLLRTKIKPEKARDFIDIVRRKGTEASSVLIAALREGDPCLFRALALS
ncbi:NACHT, LRR and PYD domains-containing protein 1b allele 4-like isoform X7 [Trachinotus anak]|uniref:NACHT, LRR and PYD domains-containing protein 1b allele 4-like isoform X7 n=1 Tax=Trachinotus anak TaxID=443729 RepID=UPI0039F1A10A